ncbi:type II secretion system F family protein [Rothia sp. P13129]|uniref:type II secretion system F family protein n=1 Tax=Rothia sp. P13129 TaxID=3402664 RepID=UPI003AD256DD
MLQQLKNMVPQRRKNYLLESTTPSVQEQELWPDMTWRMSSLLRAGLRLPNILKTVHQHIENLLSEHPLHTQTHILFSRREQRAYYLALEDAIRLLQRMYQAAYTGAPMVTVLKDLSLARSYSYQRCLELISCWYIAEKTGAPIAQAIERLARFYEREIDLDQSRRSAMAAPQTTGTILSWLPALGLTLGALMGAKPIEILTQTWGGVLLSLMGLWLALAGRLWTSKLIAQAQKGQPCSSKTH